MNKQKLNYIPPVPIQLVDNDDDDEEELEPEAQRSKSPTPQHVSSWAANVRVGECTIVTGSNGQKFAVWAIIIENYNGGHMHILKRYSEFDSLRQALVKSFPNRTSEIPKLPPKKVIGNLSNDFLVKRRKGLEFFINCVLLNPILANSNVVKQFVSDKS